MSSNNIENNSPSREQPVLTKDFLKTVSQGPGVYLMHGEREVLYVGKAADLRKRLASYAGTPDSGHSKTAVLLSKIKKITTILTGTEKEALILEASLIKKHRPRYNVILRDDKNYPLIKVTTTEDWPRISVTRNHRKDGNRYFGPYTSTTSMRSTLKLLYSLLPLRRCRTFRTRKRPCLNHQLKKCLAPCVGLVSKEEYVRMVRKALLMLEGRNKELLPQLEQEMANHAQRLEFEEAARLRDMISDLKQTMEQQVIVSQHFRNQDIFGLARQDASVAVAILFVRSGKLSGVQSYLLNDPIGEDNRILSEVIVQYYSAQRPPPEELVLPMEPEDPALLIERLTELHGKAIDFTLPKRGKGAKLITMANTNAIQVFSDLKKKNQSWENLSMALRKKLHLEASPDTIECLDISNLAGKQAVGSLVSFVKGDKNKPGYRHYRIRTKDTPDDYAMMEETLTRRISHADQDHPLPNLLIVDGGKGQLGIAWKIIQHHDLQGKIDLISIAKEKSDEGEKIFLPGRKNPLSLNRNDPVLLFIMRIRDESHRFGITFHKKLRNKQTLHSPLDAIDGISEKRKKILLQSIGSLKKIRESSVETLEKTPGIGPALARSIYSHFHPDDSSSQG